MNSDNIRIASALTVTGILGLLIVHTSSAYRMNAENWEEEYTQRVDSTFDAWYHAPKENPWDSATWAAFCAWADHDPSEYSERTENFMLDVWMETDNYIDFYDSITNK